MHLVSLSKFKKKQIVFVFLFPETSFNPNTFNSRSLKYARCLHTESKAIGKSGLTTGRHTTKNQENYDESRRHAWTLDMPTIHCHYFGFEKRLPRKNKLGIRFRFPFLFCWSFWKWIMLWIDVVTSIVTVWIHNIAWLLILLNVFSAQYIWNVFLFSCPRLVFVCLRICVTGSVCALCTKNVTW